MAISRTRTRVIAEQRWQHRYSQLNQTQQRAVDTIEGVVMVLAGPGTGKTELLAMRVSNIVRQTQLDSQNILCLTFTESGVAALRRRLIEIMGVSGYQVRVHTFHSFCHGVIQDHPEIFSNIVRHDEDNPEEQNNEHTALTEADQIALFEEILNQLPGTSFLKPFSNPGLYVRDAVFAVQKLKQEHNSPQQFISIINETEVLLKVISPIIAAFSEIKPKERTLELCEELARTLNSLKPQWPQLHFYFDYLEQIFNDWRLRTQNIDSSKSESQIKPGSFERAEGSLRTKLKNDISRWLTGVKSQLPKQRELAEVYRRYQLILAQRGQYDFADMITMVLEEWQQNDSLLAQYQEQFQYVLVDEYQDTNGAQNMLLFTLTEFTNEPNLFVVGDDKQSIYRFQGANLANLLSFYKRYGSTTTVISLTENYRSQQNILDTAQVFISHNTESAAAHIPGLQARLTSMTEKSNIPIILNEYQTSKIEAFSIATCIAELIDEGMPAENIAVIFRRNRDVQNFVPWLRKLGIRVAISGENIIEAMPIRLFIQLLTYIHTLNEAMLWNVLNIPWLNLKALEVLQTQAYARLQRQSLLVVLADDQKMTKAGVSSESSLRKLVKLLAAWQQKSVTKSLPDFLAMLLTDSGCIHYYTEIVKQPDVTRQFQVFFAEAKRFSRTNSGANLSSWLKYLIFLNQHDIGVSVESNLENIEAVHVMTAHKAKGLEFEHIFLPQVVNHTWGNLRVSNKLKLPHGLIDYETATLDPNEDERRLFYVAMTRAKNQITLSYSLSNEDGRPLVPSPFITELPIELIRRNIIKITADKAVKKQYMELKVAPEVTPREISDFVRGLLVNYVMSVTHLNNYLRCPRLFYYRNILRVPAVKTKHMAFGTAIHAALYDFLSKSRLSKTGLLQRFEHHLRQELLTKTEYRDSLDLGRKVLGAYCQYYSQTITRTVLLEYSFAAHGVTVQGVPLTGLLDKVEIIDSKKKLVSVVDYKTGRPDRKYRELVVGGEYWRQLVFYKLLCDNSSRFLYTMQSGQIDFVQPNRAGQYVKKTILIGDEDKEKVSNEIARVWQEIQKLQFLSSDVACGECEYCNLKFQLA